MSTRDRLDWEIAKNFGSFEAILRHGECMATDSFDFIKFCDNRTAWSLETFGPGDRHRGLLEHIRLELLEIERDPTDLEEWIDVIILALDGAARACGATSADVARALTFKHARNTRRTWPDWRTTSPDEPIEHVREVKP